MLSSTTRPVDATEMSASFALRHDVEAEVEVEFGEEDDADPNAPLRFKFNWRKLMRFMGPGWLMSLAYLDPGNLESDLMQGAYTGYSIVWVLWWATVMGLILQELSARIGVVTGLDVAQSIRKGYPKWLTVVIYINMELAVVTSDIQEVVGSAIAIYLLTNGAVPVWVGCIITGMDTFTFLAVHYLGVRYLEALITILIGTMGISFCVNWGETPTDVPDLVRGWILPTLPSYAVSQAISAIGAVIMPHNLYLHSGLVLSRKIDRSVPNRVYEAINYNLIESAMALLFSFFLNLAIVAVNANSFYSKTCAEDPNGPYACLPAETGMGSGPVCQLPGGGAGVCDELGLSTEGLALKHALGDVALYIWAVGLLAAGQAATMTCTYAGQIIMGGCLEINLAPWKRVLFTRGVALGPSVLIAIYMNPFESHSPYNTLNMYINQLQALQLPFAMFPVLHFASHEAMGQFRPGKVGFVVHTCLALIVVGVNTSSVVQFVDGWSIAWKGVAGVYSVVYLFWCVRMILPRVCTKVTQTERDPLAQPLP